MAPCKVPERIAGYASGMHRTSPLMTLLAVASLGVGCARAHSARLPRDKSLASLPLYFYPSADTAQPPKATVFFFGNDVGFWEAHQKLAERLSDDGYAVIGFDVKQYLERLPSNLVQRDSIFATELPALIARSIHDMNDDESPIILAGHSFGADVALWAEATARIPGVVGVLALGPTARSHLTVTALDLANLSEPSEPGSFAAADEIRKIPAGVGIALLRGSGDKRRPIDAGLVGAAGRRVDYRVIPFAGHSLKSLTIAGPMIERALDRLVAGAATASR